MKENKFLVLATFTKENMKGEKGKAFLGLNTPFYCGDDIGAAEKVYDSLPNKDKSIVKAAVKFMSEIHETMIEKYDILEVIK